MSPPIAVGLVWPPPGEVGLQKSDDSSTTSQIISEGIEPMMQSMLTVALVIIAR